VVALGTTAVAALAALPAGVIQAPGRVPPWGAFASVAVLGVIGTAVAYLLVFHLIARAGAAYASLVTYLVPPVALTYGALFLGESFGAAAFGGLVLIFGGVALGTGSRVLAWRPSRFGRSATRGSASRGGSSTPVRTPSTTASRHES
jgi:drug/metabolite transporter (DMT)-like permease